MRRVLPFALSLLVAGQATAVAGSRMVCRYTGKVMERCPCPEPRETPAVEKQGCCTVRTSAAAPVASVSREQVQVSAPRALALPVVWAAPTLPRCVSAENAVRDTGPPRLDLEFLSFRQLLI